MKYNIILKRIKNDELRLNLGGKNYFNSTATLGVERLNQH